MSINEAMRQQRVAEYADQKAYEADRLRERVKKLEDALWRIIDFPVAQRNAGLVCSDIAREALGLKEQ